MTAKATRIGGEAASVPNAEETMGISILMIPDVTYRFLSDEAAKRDRTVVQFIAEAVTAYISSPQEPQEIDAEPYTAQMRPRLKGFR